MAKFIMLAKSKTIEVVEKKDAELQPDQARARMLYSGISHGTEMHVYRSIDSSGFPASLGYSAVGEIVETGAEFKRFQKSDLVVQNAGHGSEFIVDSNSNTYRLPKGVLPKTAVIFALAGVAYNGVLESRIALGETALVFGLGVVGLCACYQMKRAGAFKVIGIDPIRIRREAALKIGADAVIDPAAGDIQSQVKEQNNGEWADVIIEASGNIRALNDAIKVIKPQSVIVSVGWYYKDAAGLDLSSDFHRRKVNIRVAQGRSTPVELSPRWDRERRMKSAIALLPEMKMDHVVTHVFDALEAAKAFELVDQRPEECIQVVLKY